MKRYKYIFFILPIFFLFIIINITKTNSDLLLNPNIFSAHFINVGQGDAILITVNNKSMLIDCGPKTSRNTIINYLDKVNIKKLDYVIASHPHEDHIGNMSTIINKYDITNFYAPKISTSSKCFESMVEALISKNKKINIISSATQNINLGKDTIVTIFTTDNLTHENLNLYSPIIKIKYLNVTYLFTGDAEKTNEDFLLSNNKDVDADILKIGHHGSYSSTSEDFLSAVSPLISIISVGIDNSYNHPSKSIINLLNKYHSTVFRTDVDGTIVISTDGNNIYQYFPNK